jgi:NTP pyrophosphatase (non-canonical NTP hydrolase)
MDPSDPAEAPSPTLAELHDRVRAFVAARDWERFHSPRNLAMALSVEAGELLELYLWSADDGPQPLNPERVPRVAGEAADVLMCLLNFCDRAGIDLAAALDDKLAVAERKYPPERVRGQALKYDEYDEYDDYVPTEED